MKRTLGILLGLTLFLSASSFASVSGQRTSRSLDPAGPGPYRVEQVDYHGDHVTLYDPTGAPVVQELHGRLYLPEGIRGPRPLILLLHGRHGTCEYAERAESFGYPCPNVAPAMADVPSYAGYDYLGTNLASHGFVVASLDANAINSYDLALLASDSGMRWRAELVGKTLDAFSVWNEEAGPGDVGYRLVDKIDFGHIGLMGHSRGGEGVARFVRFNRERTDGPTYKGLRAVFALAPTDFDAQKVNGVHFGTIVPLCDGDVYNLQGAWMFDNARFLKPDRFARVQFAINGTNHNFFNTIWTFDDGPGGGDDTGDNPVCDPDSPGNVRLTAKEQRTIGLSLMASFFRRYVAGENVFDPLMTGAVRLPDHRCPGPLSCRRTVLTSYVGASKDVRMLLLPRGNSAGVEKVGDVSISICKPDRQGAGCPTVPNRSTARQLSLSWDGRGALRVSLGAGVDVSAWDALTFRSAVNFKDARNPAGKTQHLEVTLVDSDGRRAAVHPGRHSAALAPPAGQQHQQMLLNGAWIPLRAFGGVDLNDIVAVELQVGRRSRTGSIQVAELAFQRTAAR